MRSLALLCLLIPTLSWETDVWTTPYAGVRRLDRTLTNPNFKIHALEVDLTAPGVSLTATSTAGGRGNSAARAGRRSWARLYRGPRFVLESCCWEPLGGDVGSRRAGRPDGASAPGVDPPEDDALVDVNHPLFAPASKSVGLRRNLPPHLPAQQRFGPRRPGLEPVALAALSPFRNLVRLHLQHHLHVVGV